MGVCLPAGTVIYSVPFGHRIATNHALPMRILITLLLGAGLAALLFTNPDMPAFKEFVEARSAQTITAQTGDGAFGKVLSKYGSRVAAALVNRVSERKDFYLFSIYNIDLGGDGQPDDRWRFVGVGGHFLAVEVPDMLSHEH